METSDKQDDIEALRDLDSRALADVYDRYSPAIYQYAARQLGDADLAEECVAETFSRLLKVLHAGQGPRDFLKAYLFRVAHNWITDTYRRQPPAPYELNDDMPGAGNVEGEVDAAVERGRVREALRQLTAEQQQVIMLRFVEGWELEETAFAMSRPVGAVKALQHRAIAALRRLLVREESEGTYELEG